jgi:hypothetical protein
MLNKNDCIRLVKVSAVEGAKVPTPDTDQYKPGCYNPNFSIPIDYELEGTLLQDVVEGQPLRLSRSKRDGVTAFGITVTSPIQKITAEESGIRFDTYNSVYIAQKIEEHQ